MWSKILGQLRLSVLRNYFSRCDRYSSIPRGQKYHSWGCILWSCQVSPKKSFSFISSFLSWSHTLTHTDTHVTWGLNLGQNNLSAAFLEAQALVNAFKSSSIKDAGIVLKAIEIGNEADLYSNNGARPKGFTSTEYVKECVCISLSTRSIFIHMILPCQMD